MPTLEYVVTFSELNNREWNWFLKAISRFDKAVYYRPLDDLQFKELTRAGKLRIHGRFFKPKYELSERTTTLWIPKSIYDCFHTEPELEKMGFGTIEQTLGQKFHVTWHKNGFSQIK